MLVGVVMGSKSDWPTMQLAARTLQLLAIPWEARILSAHRTPHAVAAYGHHARTWLDAIIAGAGGAAHLPGMLAAYTTVPVLGVPMPSPVLGSLDSLLSIVQMPAGVPVATFGIGSAGAMNAALFVAAILAYRDSDLKYRLDVFREQQTKEVLADELPPLHDDEDTREP